MGSSLFSIAAIKHSGQRQLGGERVNWTSTFWSHSIIEGNQGMNSRQKPEARADKKVMKLLTDLLSVLFNIAQVLPARGSADYGRLGSPTLTDQRNVMQTCRQASLRGAFSQWRFPLPRWPQLVSSWQKPTSITCNGRGRKPLHKVLWPPLAPSPKTHPHTMCIHTIINKIEHKNEFELGVETHAYSPSPGRG